MTEARIACLHPAATEWLVAMGASDLLVGVTQQCVTRTGLDLAAIRRTSVGVSRSLSADDPPVLSVDRDVDHAALHRAAPDLVITNGWDETWAPETGERLRTVVGSPVDHWSWEASTMRDVLELVLRTGRRIGRLDSAMKVLGDRELELRVWRERIGVHRRAPDHVLTRTVVLSALEPPVLAGGWTAELIDRAALLQVGPASGKPAIRTSWEEVRNLRPDLVFIALPEGEDDAIRRAALSEAAVLRPARNRRVIRYDPTGRLDEPGPGLHEAILDLAAIAHDLSGRALGSRVTVF